MSFLLILSFDPWNRMGKKWRYFKANGVLTEYKRTDQILMVQSSGNQADIYLIQKVDPTAYALSLHCSTGGPSAGCISVPEEAMIFLLQNLKTNARIIIKSTTPQQAAGY